VAAVFLLGAILYLDRTALSILAPAIRKDLGLGPLEMGWIFSAFVWGYALLHIPAGWLGDRIGARRVLSVIVVLWSAFTAATAGAWNLSSMLVIRFLFGAAESGSTPNVSRSFARWIPLGERARAQGFYFAGMSAGGALSPPLVTLILIKWGWKAAFLALGVIGLAWAAGWYLWYRDRPEDHAAVSERELEEIGVRDDRQAGASISWRTALATPNLWAILLMYFTYGYTGYIYITWFPTYLMEERHLSTSMTGLLAGLPMALGLLAKPLGGWWSDRAVKARGLVYGRRLVGAVGFGLGAAVVLPGLFAPNAYLSTLLLGLADAGAALAHGVCFAVCLDIGMKRAGTVSALMLTAGSLGNALSAIAFGAFLHYTGSWVPPFVLAMLANLTGALLWLKIDPRKQLI
jgi:MFS family permease